MSLRESPSPRPNSLVHEVDLKIEGEPALPKHDRIVRGPSIRSAADATRRLLIRQMNRDSDRRGLWNSEPLFCNGAIFAKTEAKTGSEKLAFRPH